MNPRSPLPTSTPRRLALALAAALALTGTAVLAQEKTLRIAMTAADIPHAGPAGPGF